MKTAKYKSSYGALVRDGEGRNKRYFGDYEYWDGVGWSPVTISDYEFGLIANLTEIEKPAKNLSEQLEGERKVRLTQTKNGWVRVEE